MANMVPRYPFDFFRLWRRKWLRLTPALTRLPIRNAMIPIDLRRL